MKKFFEKYDLIKITGILVILTALLTWVIPYGYFSSGEMVTEDITRMGLTNFMQYGLLGMYYFTVLVTFLFVLGGFYQVLSKTAGYQNLIIKLSGKLKGHEIPFVVIVSLFLAAICSVSNEYFPILLFIPFIITICNKLRIDKVSSFAATFGALLVGTIGSTYSAKVVGFINSTLGTTVNTYMWAKIALFISAFILLNVFTVLRMRKTLKEKKHQEYDKFEIESIKSSKKSPKTWPYIAGIVLVTITVILAYLPWSTWNVTLFTDITDKINGLSLAGEKVVNYVFGDFAAFGTWDIFTVQFVMLFATLLIHWFGKVSLDSIIESYGEGFKKMGNVVVMLLLVYTVLVFTVMYPVVPVICDFIIGLTDGFNAALTFVAMLVSSIFGVEIQYLMSLVGSYLASSFADDVKLISIITQSAFGLASFVVPSSVILMLGLSYLNIQFKEWLKFIWKFLLAMLVVIIAIILIIVLL